MISKSPLRISFFSGGSDMPSFYREHSGAALSATINKYIYVGVQSHKEPGIKLVYDKIEDATNVSEIKHRITKESLLYYNYSGDLLVTSITEILGSGSGLGSSSAFTVALLEALNDFLFRKKISKKELAELACHIEIERCGAPIGKQDQYASVYGGFNVFQFEKNDEVLVNKVNLTQATMKKLASNLMLVHSGISRSASDILQKQKDTLNQPEKIQLIKNNRDRAYKGAVLLLNNQFDAFGRLLHEAWEDKKSTVKESSFDTFDILYQHALDKGALGGKVLGAGGGGYFILYVPPERQGDVIKMLREVAPKTTVSSFIFENDK